ncbi:MAG: PIN domain-containing protein [Euryarchaeota archaeon]|nr:PIN domain-containing protein [Euryarchaeota archaeon]
MFIVVDVNVVVSALLTKGVAFDVFMFNSIVGRYEFIAPEFLLVELENHKEELRQETKLSHEEFNEVLGFLLEEISIVPSSVFSERLPEARRILSRSDKDVPYLALSLELKSAPIFSGDKRLKERAPVDVFSPKELFMMMLYKP